MTFIPYEDFNAKQSKKTTAVPSGYILTPDEQLAKAMSVEEFIIGAKQHLRTLYGQVK